MTEKPVRYGAKTTADLTQQQIDRLKQIFPECVAEGKVDDATLGDADAIAAELSDLPLALHLAGSFLAAYRHTRLSAPDACLAQLRRVGLGHLSLAETGRTLTTAHERHVARTFALSYERLALQDPTDALAQALLACSACFAPGERICW